MVTKIILFTVLLAVMVTALTYNDVFASEPQGVELARNGNGTATLSWAAQDDITNYIIKSACLSTTNDDGSPKKGKIVLGGDVQSYTFDVADEKSCKVSIRTFAENGRSDNVKIILASGDSTGRIAEVVKESTGKRSSSTPDSTPPTFHSATLDKGTGVLAITFDETIANEGFDLSTASYTGRSFPAVTQDYPQGMAFNPAGTKMFVVGTDNNNIHEYALDTPFDVSSSSYTNSSFSVSSQDTSPQGVAFNPAGTKMFLAGYNTGKIYEYALDTPFNLSTASYANSSFSVVSQTSTPYNIAFNPAGTKMFVADINNGEIYEYALTTTFDLSTASYANSSFSSTQVYVPSGVAFNPDGTKMFVAGLYNSKIYEYALGTSFDLSTASYANSSFSVGTQAMGPTGVAFNPAGTKMFVTNSESTSIYEYKLTTPVDLSKLFISESASTNDISLTGASIETVGNSTSIEIKLTAPQLQSAFELTTPELDIMQAAVSDVSGNEIAAAPNKAIAVIESVNNKDTSSDVLVPLKNPTSIPVEESQVDTPSDELEIKVKRSAQKDKPFVNFGDINSYSPISGKTKDVAKPAKVNLDSYQGKVTVLWTPSPDDAAANCAANPSLHGSDECLGLSPSKYIIYMACNDEDSGRAYNDVVTNSFTFDGLEYTFDIVNMKQDGGRCVAKVHYVNNDGLVSEFKSSNVISIAMGSQQHSA